MPRFRVQGPPFYRDEHLYHDGEVFDLPADVRPPKGSVPVSQDAHRWGDSYWKEHPPKTVKQLQAEAEAAKEKAEKEADADRRAGFKAAEDKKPETPTPKTRAADKPPA